jgi:hypothetical protein
MEFGKVPCRKSLLLEKIFRINKAVQFSRKTPTIFRQSNKRCIDGKRELHWQFRGNNAGYDEDAVKQEFGLFQVAFDTCT